MKGALLKEQLSPIKSIQRGFVNSAAGNNGNPISGQLTINISNINPNKSYVVLDCYGHRTSSYNTYASNGCVEQLTENQLVLRFSNMYYFSWQVIEFN